MLTNDPYMTAGSARVLLRAGAWDSALALLAGRTDPDAAELKARILVDRYWWRLDDPEPASASVSTLDPGGVAGYLSAQLAYTRLLFGRDPRPDDARVAAEGFRAAASVPGLAGWAAFWLGVLADNVDGDPATARTRYDQALRICHAEGDLLLESYVIRHIGGHVATTDPAMAEAALRRSLHLRAALGARPQTAAAQVALADALPDGTERATLREAARATAGELGLTWLAASLADV